MTIRRTACLVWLALAAITAHAQTTSLYDDFSAATLDSHRWQIVNEDGSALAATSTSGGLLTVTGASNRTGAMSLERLPEAGAVELDARGWTGTNQILQLYSGDGGFDGFVEFGMEGVDTDGTPIVHVWLPGSAGYQGRSPVSGPVDSTHPAHMRIERNGTTLRFYINGSLIYQTDSTALTGDAAVMLYGWQTSVSKWDNVRLSGPQVRINGPVPNTTVGDLVDVFGFADANTLSWTLDEGAGTAPSDWATLAAGSGPVNARLTQWDTSALPGGAYTLRLTAYGADGYAATYRTPVSIFRSSFHEPFEGQTVGSAYSLYLENVTGVTRADYYDNGVPFASSTTPPFVTRRVTQAGDDGAHTITATLTKSDGSTVTTGASVDITVQRDLYGGNAHPSDTGRSFVFPDGSVTVAIGENDGTAWPGLSDLYFNNNATATENYVTSLRASGVNVMRVFLEDAGTLSNLIENPLGTYNPRGLSFWDQFLPMCARHGMTVLISPWDTFWMNQPWSNSPYNSANGGPCNAQSDFITSPAARVWQKARFKTMIDRWGNSPAVFGWDLLNEHDIWWDPATPEQRQDWINDMSAYVQDYELQKWGHRHMVTVSSANSNPGGVIGDVVYRHPRFDFANTHQYYGAVSNPQNIIDPALAVNGGTKDSILETVDIRPYMDTESGPISLSYPWLTNNTPFDDQYYHHMAWAHFATGGTGIGMRWPYRDPHYLDAGMHATQQMVATVAANIHFATFVPQNVDSQLSVNAGNFIVMGSADANQGIFWLTEDTRAHAATSISGVTLTWNGAPAARFAVDRWDLTNGQHSRRVIGAQGGKLNIALNPITLDAAVTVVRLAPGDANGDGHVNASDVSQLMRIAAGFQVASVDDQTYNDLDGDGVITLADAVRLMWYVAGTSPSP